MARSIPFSETNLASGNVTNANTDVANSRFNPVQVTSRVSLYAAQSEVNNVRLTFSLGSEVQADDVFVPFATSAALSTRDHLVGSGVAFRGQKITVGYRETGATGTAEMTGLVIVEPI